MHMNGDDLMHMNDYQAIGGTKEQEYRRSAELLMEIIKGEVPGSNMFGLFMAIAFLADAGYSNKDLHALLPHLQKVPGALIKKTSESQVLA